MYEPSQRSPARLGSGFFIASYGLVATNLHVVAGADRATVTLASGETREVLGYVAAQPRADLVVLRVDRPWPDGLPLGNSDSVPPGASLVAIGSPEGFRNSVSTGVSSGLRVLDGVTWLQHSAATSPGSSGGPLLDNQGRVIGLTTLAHRDGQNINFAAPINTLRAVLPGDSVRPLSTLPGGNLADAGSSSPDRGEMPAGMTGVYVFGSPVAVYALSFVVQLPSGALGGALFALHPSGFYDVVPLSSGRRPGKTRDFDLSVGCVTFTGWVRRDGSLGGDATIECAGESSHSQPFEAVPLYRSGFPAASSRSRSRPDAGFSGPHLWVLRLEAGSDSLSALLATVSRPGSPETARGALHAWRKSPNVSRHSLAYTRGRASALSDSVWLMTLDSGSIVSLRESRGAVTGTVTVGGRNGTRYGVVGYRQDLTFCFERDSLQAAHSRQLREYQAAVRTNAMPLTDRVRVDSMLRSKANELKRCADHPAE